MTSQARYEMHSKDGVWKVLCFSGSRASWFTRKDQLKAWAKRHGIEVKRDDLEKLV